MYEKYLSSYQHLTRAGAENSLREPLPEEFVVWAYRLFLDREPEDPSVVSKMAGSFASSKELRQTFLSSEEYGIKDGVHRPAAPARVWGRKHLEIERITDRATLMDFFANVKDTWTELGATEPYWSVLSADRFRQAQISDHMREFEESGQREASNLFELLNSHGARNLAEGECIEYGCGVGRVTRWLSERFKRVSACDISASHIDIARRYMRGAGRSNVDFRLIAELDEIEHLPATDFFYTMIVLQHNPPPLIEVIIRGLAGALKPGGYGLFQVPTHRSNYRFSVEEYLASLSNLGMPHHIEMHIMPMDRVFSIIHEAGCIPVQVFEDDWAGPGYESFSFLIHKPEKPG